MSLSKNQNDAPIEDYLDEDKPIPGQKYVCLSFVSPENVLEDKKLYTLYKYMKSLNKEMDTTYEKFKEEYKNYCEDFEEEIQSEFDVISEYQTNVRGVKVRGVYDSERAANIRAQVLQKIDNSFHVFVGQVGFWLPWEPNANKIQEQEYLEENLNRLVKEYNKNQVKKDMFYEEKKAEQKKAALEEAIKQQKLNEEQRRRELEEARKKKELEAPVEQVNTEAPVETSEAPVETSEAPVEQVNTEAPVETSEATVETSEAPVENIQLEVSGESTPEENTDNLKESLDKNGPLDG